MEFDIRAKYSFITDFNINNDDEVLQQIPKSSLVASGSRSVSKEKYSSHYFD